MPSASMIRLDLAPGVQATAIASSAEISTDLLSALELDGSGDPHIGTYGDT